MTCFTQEDFNETRRSGKVNQRQNYLKNIYIKKSKDTKILLI